jgi:uncharacterized protein (DUF58 family)
MSPAPARDGVAGRRARRRYHFHFPGVLYVCVTLFLAVGAVNSQNNLLFFALGLAIGGLLVSGVLSGAALIGVRVERLPIPTGSVGKPLTIRYRVSNSNALFPAFGLHVEELPGRGRAAGWRAFFPSVSAFVPYVPAKSFRQVRAVVVPERRGAVSMDVVQIWSTFPFGLAKKSTAVSLPHSGLVHPPELALRPGIIARITAKAPYGLGGQRSQGMGEEFFGLREYSPGDPPRNIAWKPSARTGTLAVRQYSAPAPSRLWVVLAAPDGADGADVEMGVALAASILAHAERAGVAVGLAVPRAGILHPPRQSRWHLDRMLGDLALADLGAGGSSSGVFPDAAARSGACVVVHAGAVDQSQGPRHARHLSVLEADRLVDDSPETRRVLAIMRGSRGGPASRRARWRGRGGGHA